MSTYKPRYQALPPLKHFPIAQPIKDFADVIKTEDGDVQSLENFYLNMLNELEPAKRKATYLAEMSREIEAIFRIDGSIAVLMFDDKTVHCTHLKLMTIIDHMRGPISVGRLSLQLHSVFQDRVSVDCFSSNKPTFEDFKMGVLFSDEDYKAGLTADSTSMNEHMCEWLQLYQLWLQDYLYFNLAQISKEPSKKLKQRNQTLSPLSTHLIVNA